jgi:hypothetical protein
MLAKTQLKQMTIRSSNLFMASNSREVFTFGGSSFVPTWLFMSPGRRNVAPAVLTM